MKIILGTTLLCLLSYCGLLLLDKLYPPDLWRYRDLSAVVNDRHGQWLYVYLSGDDKYRLSTSHTALPDDYLKLLINYEDKDFYSHNGIDFSAIVRALGQNIVAGRTLSGASTLSMQTAKLLSPRPRTLKSKVIEAFRAWQLERRFSKAEILDMYTTLAPAGGNREGLTAAAHYYLNKPLGKISLAEAAWLVALPQSPKRLSHDAAAAVAARNKVLKRAVDKQIISTERYRQASNEPLTITPTPFPRLAPHLSNYSRNKFNNNKLGDSGSRQKIPSWLDASLQRGLQQVLSANLPLQQQNANLVGGILANANGEWLAYAGSADFFAAARQGQVDMLTAVRSPGSTLKPFITLFAFDWLNYQPQTSIDDTPIVGAYSPTNYDSNYQGTITLAQALRRSRNVPAVRLLHKIKPDYFVNKLEKHGVKMFFPANGRANLSVALGGVGVRGDALTKAYSQLANCTYADKSYQADMALADTTSCRQVSSILQQSQDGQGRVFFGSEPVAFKTGTAYGWRDRWIFAYTKDYTIVLWSGRADGQFAERRASAETLIPLLRQVVGLLPNPPQSYRAFSLPTIANARLPRRLQHVGVGRKNTPLLPPTKQYNGFAVVSPLPNSLVDLHRQPLLSLEVQNGKPPFIYLLNDSIIAQTADRRLSLQAQRGGSYHLLVVDADGNTAESRFSVQQQLNNNKHKGKRAVFD